MHSPGRKSLVTVKSRNPCIFGCVDIRFSGHCMKFGTIVFICFFWNGMSAQDTINPCENGICPAYKIILKNNYQINIGDTINNRRTIRLIGPEIDTILRSVKVNISSATLGWLVADYQEFFVLNTNYSGNYPKPEPLSVYIYQKSTGALLANGPLVAYKKSENALLFIKYDQQENLGLFDTNTMKIDFFSPVETLCEIWWHCIKNTYITEKDMTIDYRDWNNNTKRKIYVR